MTSPSTPPAASDGPRRGDERAAARWGVAGLAVLAVWALLLVVAVALWVRVAFLGTSGTADASAAADAADGADVLRLVGVPFVLLALGILWWVWRSARHLRHRRREGWVLPIALGAVALVQSAVTTLPLVLSGAGDTGQAAGLFAGGALLGTASAVVGLLGRRSWSRLAEAPAP